MRPVLPTRAATKVMTPPHRLPPVTRPSRSTRSPKVGNFLLLLLVLIVLLTMLASTAPT